MKDGFQRKDPWIKLLNTSPDACHPGGEDSITLPCFPSEQCRMLPIRGRKNMPEFKHHSQAIQMKSTTRTQKVEFTEVTYIPIRSHFRVTEKDSEESRSS